MAELTKIQKLGRLKNYGTKYELVLSKGTRKYLVVYSAGKSRATVMAGIRKFANRIMGVTGAHNVVWATKASQGAHMGSWSIAYSGRTQREAISAGELPWIGDSTAKVRPVGPKSTKQPKTAPPGVQAKLLDAKGKSPRCPKCGKWFMSKAQLKHHTDNATRLCNRKK